ncbi:MAG TPA: hypothetical protein VFQ88_14605 [Nevskiaceae bacterium]|nr:hypothetical protein [Nevskiaceae bacterium]
MFSFGELVVIILVALVVLGPQKTHRLVQQIGRWVGRSRVYLRNLGEELERESGAGDALRELRETQKTMREQMTQLRSNVVNLDRQVRDTARQVQADLTPDKPDTPSPTASDASATPDVATGADAIATETPPSPAPATPATDPPPADDATHGR